MEANNIAKQMIGFQKTAFDNNYSTMVFFQNKTEDMMNDILKQMPWVPKEAKKPMQEVSEIIKKSRDDFKIFVDDSYTKLEEMATKCEL